jgi:hypothetical protein
LGAQARGRDEQERNVNDVLNRGEWCFHRHIRLTKSLCGDAA